MAQNKPKNKPETDDTTPNTEQQPNEKMYTYDEVQAIVKGAVAEAVAEALKNVNTANQGNQVIVVPEEKVTLLFIGGIAKGTSVTLGKLGKINKDGGTIDISKKEFLQGINETIDILLAKRKLIVLDGLDAEERERYGVDYKEGELLTAKQFHKLLDYADDVICDIYDKLCDQHQETVARVFISSYTESKDPRVSTDKLKKLNKISKKKHPEGVFTELLKKINADEIDE